MSRPAPLLILFLALALTGAACAAQSDDDQSPAAAASADAVDPTLPPVEPGDQAQATTPIDPPAPTPSATAPASSDLDSPPAGQTDAPDAEVSTTPEDIAASSLELVQVATLDQPTAMAVRPGDSDRVYVAERPGRVRPIGLDGTVGPPLLDISEGTTTDSERGLLGLTWSPDGAQLFLSSTDEEGATVIEAVDVSDDVLDATSRRQILRVEQPASNHNGGNITFGPDGMLWIGLGDGGAADDRFDNGQRPETLLGTMLRIDPLSAEPYGIPADNPFDGSNGAREVYAYGLRNPWRFSFDEVTGDLWIADVGQNAVEEINRVSPADAGLNYGWPRFEGDRVFDGQPVDGPVVEPVHTYDHSRGCSITGGHVYRGQAIPELRGAYVYADYCNGQIFALAEGGAAGADVDTGMAAEAVVSFGQDAAGELYVLSLEGPVYRITPA